MTHGPVRAVQLAVALESSYFSAKLVIAMNLWTSEWVTSSLFLSLHPSCFIGCHLARCTCFFLSVRILCPLFAPQYDQSFAGWINCVIFGPCIPRGHLKGKFAHKYTHTSSASASYSTRETLLNLSLSLFSLTQSSIETFIATFTGYSQYSWLYYTHSHWRGVNFTFHPPPYFFSQMKGLLHFAFFYLPSVKAKCRNRTTHEVS